MSFGPLAGVRAIELAGIGPGPYCAMLLSDLGADVIRVARPPAGESTVDGRFVLMRGRRSIAVDLKHAGGVELVLQLAETADILFEPFRPGVAERLGVGPDACFKRNPRLVYGRVTGWGQTGPYANMPGHDINYIALAGVLHGIGRVGEPPIPPLNLIGDFAGGGMLLAVGMLCALLEARSSGQGQVVDTAMLDGAASMLTLFAGYKAMGEWQGERGTNLLDGGAWFYNVYETRDGGYMAVGAIEPQFCAELCQILGLEGFLERQYDVEHWPRLRQEVADVFRSRTRDEWCEAFEGTSACVSPVLSMDEAAQHPHVAFRGTYVDAFGITQPATVPRFSRTPGEIQRGPALDGEHTHEVLEQWLGLDAVEVSALVGNGVAYTQEEG